MYIDIEAAIPNSCTFALALHTYRKVNYSTLFKLSE